jgi:hypothetical protein
MSSSRDRTVQGPAPSTLVAERQGSLSALSQAELEAASSPGEPSAQCVACCRAVIVTAVGAACSVQAVTSTRMRRTTALRQRALAPSTHSQLQPLVL